MAHKHGHQSVLSRYRESNTIQMYEKSIFISVQNFIAQKLTFVKAFVVILVASLPAGCAGATAGFAFVQFLTAFFIATLCRNGSNNGNGNGKKFHIFNFLIF